MPRVIFTAQVENSEKWEKGYRTHGELLKKYDHCRSPTLQRRKRMKLPSMRNPKIWTSSLRFLNLRLQQRLWLNDGVKRETVKVYVLDKEIPFLTFVLEEYAPKQTQWENIVKHYVVAELNISNDRMGAIISRRGHQNG